MVPSDLSIITLITHASLLVQLVMLLLLLVSVFSWTVIFSKWKTLKQARQATTSFEDRFWSGGDLNRLYEQVNSSGENSGLERIFTAGFKEFVRLRKQGDAEPMAVIEGAQRIPTESSGIEFLSPHDLRTGFSCIVPCRVVRQRMPFALKVVE